MVPILAATSIVLSLITIAVVGWVLSRLDVVRVAGLVQASRADADLWRTETTNKLNAFLEDLTTVADTIERRRRKAQGAVDQQRQQEERAAAEAPPADEMEAARQRLRSQGVRFAG